MTPTGRTACRITPTSRSVLSDLGNLKNSSSSDLGGFSSLPPERWSARKSYWLSGAGSGAPGLSQSRLGVLGWGKPGNPGQPASWLHPDWCDSSMQPSRIVRLLSWTLSTRHKREMQELAGKHVLGNWFFRGLFCKKTCSICLHTAPWW